MRRGRKREDGRGVRGEKERGVVDGETYGISILILFFLFLSLQREMNPELRPDELTYTTIINACRAARDVEAEALMKDQKHLLQKELMTRKALRA